MFAYLDSRLRGNDESDCNPEKSEGLPSTEKRGYPPTSASKR